MRDGIEAVLSAIYDAVGAVVNQLLRVALYPVDPEQRIYFLYLLSSLLLAAFVYLRLRARDSRKNAAESFFSFLFPRKVWSEPSAWLDVRYFFFHQLLRLVIYGSIMAGSIALFASLAHDGAGWLLGSELPVRTDVGFVSASVLVLATVLAYDFAAYVTHYLQHRWWVLWEFHKVHHSATVLHPLTNYREHPFDNLAYAVSHGLAVGAVSGGSAIVLGYTPDLSILLSGSLVVLLYNVLGYNLRHSHIWVKWPGPLSKLFGSPAHHQVHHSCNPDHIDKNFAFMFPFWDVLFGTYCLPEDHREVRFGLGAGEETEFRSCLGLYFVPFRNLARRWRAPTGRNTQADLAKHHNVQGTR